MKCGHIRMGMNEKYDVIVIGCGPAGAATAITCASKGLRVAMIDGESFPRQKPGETLHPGIEPVLHHLGVAQIVHQAGFLRHKGHWITWEQDRQFVPFGADETGDWYGYQARRTEFDSILLERAMSLGVEVYLQHRALRPIIQNNRVVGVVTVGGQLMSSFLIDGTGRQHWLAKKLRLPMDTYSPQLIARYGYVQGECHLRDDEPAIVADHEGWTWTAKIGAGMYQWTRLSFGNIPLENRWLPKEYQELTPIGKTLGADMTWRAVRQPAGPGYYLVGDAASVLDPASSHGVLKAIMSGMMVGHLIDKVNMTGCKEHLGTEEYCKWIRKWFQHDVKKLKELYLLLPINRSKGWLETDTSV